MAVQVRSGVQRDSREYIHFSPVGGTGPDLVAGGGATQKTLESKNTHETPHLEECRCLTLTMNLHITRGSGFRTKHVEVFFALRPLHRPGELAP